jgi:oxalate---CoA ligase
VRQRILAFDNAPGQDSYLRRLETRWSELWSQYRGTELLPDPSLEDAVNFPIIEHIEFLRKHVDKNAL